MDESMELLAETACHQFKYMEPRLLVTIHPDAYEPGGAYAKAVPSFDSVSKMAVELTLSPLVPPFDHNELLREAHVTLVYSKGTPIDRNAVETLEKMGILKLRSFCAEVTEAVYWDGHNDTGYVVLKLRSEHLDGLNAAMLAAGAKHSFPQYEAHMTVGAKVGPKTPEMEAWLANANRLLKGFSVEFDRVMIEGLRDD